MTGGLVALTYGIVRTDALGWGVDRRARSARRRGGAARRVRARRGAGRAGAAGAAVDLQALTAAGREHGRRAHVLGAVLDVLLRDAVPPAGARATTRSQAGLSFLPMTLSVFTGSSLAARLVARFGVRAVVTLGMLSAAAGLLLLTGVRPGGKLLRGGAAGRDPLGARDGPRRWSARRSPRRRACRAPRAGLPRAC